MSFQTHGLEPNKATVLNKVFNTPTTKVVAIKFNIPAEATDF